MSCQNDVGSSSLGMLTKRGLMSLGNSGSGQFGTIARATLDAFRVFRSAARGFLKDELFKVSSVYCCHTASVTRLGSMSKPEQNLPSELKLMRASRVTREFI